MVVLLGGGGVLRILPVPFPALFWRRPVFLDHGCFVWLWCHRSCLCSWGGGLRPAPVVLVYSCFAQFCPRLGAQLRAQGLRIVTRGSTGGSLFFLRASKVIDQSCFMRRWFHVNFWLIIFSCGSGPLVLRGVLLGRLRPLHFV